MKIRATIFLLICVFYQPIYVNAQHNPDAHAHGEGRMTLVFDKGQLLVEMKTPAANMLGFEHQPKSDLQWQTLELLEQKLSDPKNLIMLEPDCELKESSVKLPFKRIAHKESHKSETKSEHKHEHEHKKAHNHHSKKDETAESESHQSNHSDIYTQYEWHCAKPQLPKLKLRYFDEYPSFEQIKVEWIVNGSQGATQLHKKNKILDIE